MPSPSRLGSPSMRYKGAGCTTERAAHPGEVSAGTEPTTCGVSLLPAQNRQGATLDSNLSFSGSSPVMTHERVIGSLRNCIPARITLLAVRVNSGTKKSGKQVTRLALLRRYTLLAA